MRARLLLAAAVGLVLAGNDLAAPAWTASAAGSSTARAAVLAPPTQLSAVRAPSGVDLAWTASASGWAGGYQVLRSPTDGGTLVPLAVVDAQTARWTDTTASAGSWHYVVRTRAESWSSAASATSSDRVYYVRGTSSFTDGRCPASGSTADLAQGHVAPSGAGTSVSVSTVTLCTDRFSTGQVLPAGSTTVNAYVANSNSKSCTVDVVLRHGGTVLGTGSGTVAGSSTLHLSPWAFATAGVTFADGDRLTVQLTARANSSTNNCSGTTLSGDGSLAPSNVTLAG